MLLLWGNRERAFDTSFNNTFHGRVEIYRVTLSVSPSFAEDKQQEYF